MTVTESCHVSGAGGDDDRTLYAKIDIATSNPGSLASSSPLTIQQSLTTSTTPSTQARTSSVPSPELLFFVAVQSDDPAKGTERISATVSGPADEPEFVVKSNIPGARGPAWRNLVNYLRTQFDKLDGDLPLKSVGDGPRTLDPHLIRRFLQIGTRPRQTSCRLFLSPSILRILSPLLQSWCPSELLSQASSGQPVVEIRLSTPPGYSHLDIADTAITIASEFALQFSQNKQESDLESACFLHWISSIVTRDDPSRHYYLDSMVEFAKTLVLRFNITRNVGDLRCDLAILRDNIEEAAQDMSSLHVRVYRDSLVMTLVRYLLAGLDVDPDDQILGHTITWLDTTMADHPPLRPALLNNFAVVYFSRYEKLGKLPDLDANIAILKRAVVLFSQKDQEWAECTFNLVRSMEARQRITHSYEDLEIAARYCQEMLDREAQGMALNVARWEILLLFSLMVRTEDVNRSIAALREALELCPQDEKRRYQILAELSSTLQRRYNISIEPCPDDADEARRLRKEALSIVSTEGDQATKANLLYEHASTLPSGSIAEADEFVKLAKASLEAHSKLPDRYLPLSLLGRALMLRFKHSSDQGDLEEAQECLIASLDIASSGAGLHQRAHCLAVLALVYSFPETKLYNIPRALGYLEMCLEDTRSEAIVRLTYLRNVLDELQRRCNLVASQHISSVADLAIRAVKLLPDVAYLDMDIKSSLASLRIFDRAAVEASIFCEIAGKNIEAVAVVEQGRAIFWTQALKIRPRFLAALSPDLQKRLSDLSQQIEQMRYLPQTLESPLLFAEFARRRLLADQYESLLAQIRTENDDEPVSGLSQQDLIGSGQQGPVVILIAHSYRCSAYILIRLANAKTPFKILMIRLCKISRGLLSQYVAYLQEVNAQARDDAERTMRDSAAGSWSSDLEDNRAFRRAKPACDIAGRVLKPLWEQVVKPIFDGLGIKSAKGRARTRLWWCPTAEFTFLPIHAAGDYSPGGESCFDYIVSSYIPNIAALVHARKTFQLVPTRDAKVMLAAVPRPYKGMSLNGTLAELKEIASIVPEDQRIRLPASDDALLDPTAGLTVQTAIDSFPQASILHLASHGVQDHNNPLNSGFLLRDDKLTIAQLMPLPLPHAFLAFLSACETAKGDAEQSDQAIHLAATMLFAGFKSVVGTMWSMADVDGPHVAGYVYRQIFKPGSEYLDPDDIPNALDEAVQQLRAQNVPPSRWATFIHLGI